MSRPQPNRRPARKTRQGDNRRWWVVAAAIGVGVVIVAGVLAGGGSSPPNSATPRDSAIVASGEDLFQANCAVCHGTDLTGTNTGPPLLNTIYAPNHHGDESFQRAVQLGVPPHHWEFGPMPPVQGLDRSDVEQIIAFVRTQQERAGIFSDPTH